MGGRYFITGVQLGMLMALKDEKERRKILQEIMENQFIENVNKKGWGRSY